VSRPLRGGRRRARGAVTAAVGALLPLSGPLAEGGSAVRSAPRDDNGIDLAGFEPTVGPDPVPARRALDRAAPRAC
jgi:hypothetical protein